MQLGLKGEHYHENDVSVNISLQFQYDNLNVFTVEDLSRLNSKIVPYKHCTQ